MADTTVRPETIPMPPRRLTRAEYERKGTKEGPRFWSADLKCQVLQARGRL